MLSGIEDRSHATVVEGPRPSVGQLLAEDGFRVDDDSDLGLVGEVEVPAGDLTDLFAIFRDLGVLNGA